TKLAPRERGRGRERVSRNFYNTLPSQNFYKILRPPSRNFYTSQDFCTFLNLANLCKISAEEASGHQSNGGGIAFFGSKDSFVQNSRFQWWDTATKKANLFGGGDKGG